MPVIGLSCWERPFDTEIALGERHHMLSSTYTTALVAAGGTPVLLPSVDAEFAGDVVSRIDALVVTGGSDIDPARYGHDNTHSVGIDPVRDAWELALVRAARDRTVPTLGVCRGCQLLNIEAGGTLHQHVWGTDEHPPLRDGGRLLTGHHDVELTGILAELYGKDARTVNSLHHQSIDAVGDGFEVVAAAADGGVEGLASTGAWSALGVQWHPERHDLADERPLFEWIARRAVDDPIRRGSAPRRTTARHPRRTP